MEGFWYPNGTLQTHKVRSLSRTYPEAVQGVLNSFSFDPTTGLFTMAYVAKASIAAPTQIFVALEFLYPLGFNVTIAPSSAATWRSSTTLQNRIEVMAVQDGPVTVTIVAK